MPILLIIEMRQSDMRNGSTDTEVGRKASKKPMKRSFDLLAPVAAVIAKHQRNHPGERFAWTVNKALWELLKPYASKTELAAAAERKLEKRA